MYNKNITSACLAFLLALTASGAVEKPNILFIFADDMAPDTIHALGNREIETPHLDQLSRRSTVFTHAYNSGSWSGAVCIASRTMLQTGRQLWHARAEAKKIKTEYVEKNKLWPQLMQSQGYETYFSGKWHVGSDQLARRSFNHTAHIRPGMPRYANGSGYNRPKSGQDHNWKPWDKKNGGFWKGGKHWSEVLADDGVKFIRQAAKSDKPFFMMLAFNAPHDPRQSPRKFVDKYPYKKIKVPKNFLPEYPYEICNNKKLRDERLAPFPRTRYAVQVHRAEYYALITHMDVQIGRILDALEKSGKADSTIVIFSADHGLSVGHHGLMGKQNMFDHSVRVPWMIAGPGIPEQRRIGSPIYLQDAMATALDLSGMEKPEHVEFESVLPHIRGTGKEKEAIYGSYLGKQRMVRTGKYKLIRYPEIGVELLFDMQRDPDETTDLSGDRKYSATLKKMQKLMQRQMEAMGDPLAGK